MGEFYADEHYIYYWGQESLRRDGTALIVKKRVRNTVLGCNLKTDRMISDCFQGKTFSLTLIKVFAPTSNVKEAEVVWFYEDLQDLLELTCTKDALFVIGLECKSKKSGDTWRNRQVWPWSTKWSRAKSNRVFPREHTGHSKHPLPTTQQKTIHSYHQMVNTEIRLIIFFAAEDGEALYSQQKQDWELTVAQIMNSLLPNSDWNWRK